MLGEYIYLPKYRVRCIWGAIKVKWSPKSSDFIMISHAPLEVTVITVYNLGMFSAQTVVPVLAFSWTKRESIFPWHQRLFVTNCASLVHERLGHGSSSIATNKMNTPNQHGSFNKLSCASTTPGRLKRLRGWKNRWDCLNITPDQHSSFCSLGWKQILRTEKR